MRPTTERLEARVLRLQTLMLFAAVVGWLAMLTRALADHLQHPWLDRAGLWVAVACLVGFLLAWLAASRSSGNDEQILLTGVDDEHARLLRLKAERFGFRAVLGFLLLSQLLAGAQRLDLGVAATSQLALMLGLASALAAFLWQQRG